MPLSRLTNILQVSTVPTDPAQARVHVAGWSESFWTMLDASAYVPLWRAQNLARANLLPLTGAIVGQRSQLYTIAGNKLIPGGSAANRVSVPGSSTGVTDLPQVALQMSARGAGVANSSRLVLRAMPDSVMEGGEYFAGPAFKASVTRWVNTMIGTNFGFIGRDLAQASVSVLLIAANVITVDLIPPTGLAPGDFIRLHRVHDINDDPVIGAFRVTGINGLTITCAGLNATVNAPSGTLRRDRLAFFNYQSIDPIRAVVKKVGRPFEQYRGRRSKSRV